MLKKYLNRIWYSPTINTWFNFFSRAFIFVAVTPLLLNKLSVEHFSILLLYQNIILLSYLADFGFLTTFSRLVSYLNKNVVDINIKKVEKDKSEGVDISELNKLFSNMRWVYFALSLVVFLLLVGVYFFYIKKLEIINNNQYEGNFSYFILMFTIPFAFWGRKYESLLIGMNYVATVNRWNALFNVLSGTTLLVTIFISPNIVLIISVIQFFSLITYLRNRFLSYHFFPGLIKGFLPFDSKLFNIALIPAVKTALVIVGSQSVNYIAILIFSANSKPVELATFLLASRIITAVNEFSWAPFYSQIPKFSALRANNQLAELYALTSKKLNLSLYAFIIPMFFVTIFTNPFLNLINSNVKDIPVYLFVIYLFVIFFERHHAMHAQIYMTTNDVPFYLPVIISGLINIFILYVFLSFGFSFYSMPLSLLIANALINNWWNVKKSLSSLNVSFHKYFKEFFIYPFSVLILLVILILLISWVSNAIIR